MHTPYGLKREIRLRISRIFALPSNPSTAMTLNERIEKDYVAAYKARDQLKLDVLRLFKTAAKNMVVDMCAVMNAIMAQYKGRVDGKGLSAAVRARLAG